MTNDRTLHLTRYLGRRSAQGVEVAALATTALAGSLTGAAPADSPTDALDPVPAPVPTDEGVEDAGVGSTA